MSEGFRVWGAGLRVGDQGRFREGRGVRGSGVGVRGFGVEEGWGRVGKGHRV